MNRKHQPGRPPLFDEPVSTRITFSVTPAQRLELRRVASDNGTGMSGIIREAVNEFVSDYREQQVFNKKKR